MQKNINKFCVMREGGCYNKMEKDIRGVIKSCLRFHVFSFRVVMEDE